MAEELTVVTKAYDLTLGLLSQINQLPRSSRFVLGDRIETTMLDILELLLEATYAREKGGVLRNATRKLEKLGDLLIGEREEGGRVQACTQQRRGARRAMAYQRTGDHACERPPSLHCSVSPS